MDIKKTAHDIGKSTADEIDLDEFGLGGLELGSRYITEIYPTLTKLAEHGHIERGEIIKEFRNGVKEAKGLDIEEETVSLTDKGLNFVRNLIS